MVSTVSMDYSLPDDVLTLNIDFFQIVIFDYLTFLHFKISHAKKIICSDKFLNATDFIAVEINKRKK